MDHKNNAMPFFVTLTVIVYRQYYCALWFLNTFVPGLCRFLFQSPFLFSSFFFSWFLYGEDVRIVSDSEFIFLSESLYIMVMVLKNMFYPGATFYGRCEVENDQGDAMSMSTSNSFQGFVAMMAV